MNDIKLTTVNPSCELVDINKLVSNRFKNCVNEEELYALYSPCEIVMEHIGRICYNSHDAMTDKSIEKFLGAAAKKGHRSIFEFGQLQYTLITDESSAYMIFDLLINNKYINIELLETERKDLFLIKITGSPRAFIEILEMIAFDTATSIPIEFYVSLYNRLSIMLPSMVSHWETIDGLAAFETQLQVEVDDEFGALADITADYSNRSAFTKFLAYVVCDRAVSHEIVRHRPVSYMQESQRYIRFDANNPYIICMGTQQEIDMGDQVKEIALTAFQNYSVLLKDNRPENARVVLPNCAKTSIFIYADKKEYRHFFRMRQSKFAYPPIKEVFDSLYFQLIDNKFI